MKSINSIWSGAAIAGLSILSMNVAASGFQLFEENAVSTGDYNAGGAAIAEDASTAFYNPAGLTRLKKQQVVLSAVGVWVDQDVSGTVVNNARIVTPFGSPVIPVSTQTGKSNFNEITPVPAFHYALPLDDRWSLGLSVTAPFGLETDYSDTSIFRYAGTLSKLEAIDISPVAAIQINEQLSIGAGVDVYYIQAELNQMVGLGALSPLILGVPNSDTKSENVADDWELGWHGGILYQFSPSTRAGLSYHSKVNVKPSGDSKFKGPIADSVVGGPIKSKNLSGHTTLPGYAILSLYHDMNEQWAIMGSVIYTQWSQFTDVSLDNVAAVTQGVGPGGLTFTPSKISVSIAENFRDTWRFALGLNYKYNKMWLFRAGIGYDQDPTNNTDRNVRLPDGDRYAVAVGARVKPWDALAFDFGYTHLFVDDGRVRNTTVAGQQITMVSAKAKSQVNMFGVQATLDIG